jgi:hypothetical protein
LTLSSLVLLFDAVDAHARAIRACSGQQAHDSGVPHLGADLW